MDSGLMKSMGYMMGRENGNAPFLFFRPFACLPGYTNNWGIGGECVSEFKK